MRFVSISLLYLDFQSKLLLSSSIVFRILLKSEFAIMIEVLFANSSSDSSSIILLDLLIIALGLGELGTGVVGTNSSSELSSSILLLGPKLLSITRSSNLEKISWIFLLLLGL